MFIGHYALAFAVRPQVRKPGLGALMFAVSWADLLWPFMLLLGLEQVRIVPGITAHTPLDFVSYPWSHSAAMLLLWAALLAFLLGRSWTGRERAWFGALVFSHWVLDWISHRPDMPLWPNGPRLGLGLWNSVPATAVVELAMFTAGLILYLRRSRAKDWRGHLSLWSLLAVLAVFFVMDNAGGPPPPTPRALALFALGGWLPVLWTFWIERTRAMVEVP
ncbi:MAG TPA: metal-dependent hydrolase [Holophagaceae bacterium]|nr:metal-dependent hydrolase [Holophagaceae bacterium]